VKRFLDAVVGLIEALTESVVARPLAGTRSAHAGDTSGFRVQNATRGIRFVGCHAIDRPGHITGRMPAPDLIKS
jgi:hypothetical protein